MSSKRNAKAGGAEVQDHLQLQSQSEVSLYTGNPVSKNNKKTNGDEGGPYLEPISNSALPQ